MSAPKMPPRAARKLLVRALPAELREDVAHDLDELYARRASSGGALRARLWYIGQVISFSLRFAGERSQRSGERGRSRLAGLSLDWKLGARMLLKHPGLSLIGGVALAVAIAVGAFAYEMIHESVNPDLPLADGDRIVRVENFDAAASSPEPRSLHDYVTWRDQLTRIEELGAARVLTRNLIGADGSAEPVRVAEITASAFPMTRVPPLLGRPLSPADEQPGAEDVAVLGHDVWQRRFGADRSIIGRVVQLGRTPVTIVGVMPEGFGFPRAEQLWVPLRIASTAPREGPPVQMFGRLAPGVSLESAQAELTTFGQRAASASPSTHAQLRPRVLPFVGPVPGESPRPILLAIYAVVALIMLVVCANVATLVFARTALRESEIIVRNALGATRGRIMMQLFVEAFVLSLVAAAAGLGLAFVATRFVIEQSAIRQASQPFWRNSRLELETVLYALGLAVVAGVLVGLLPAMKATGRRVQDGLRRVGAGGGSMRFGGVWSVIIVVQVAITVVALPIGIGVSSETIRDNRVRAQFVANQYLSFRAELDEPFSGDEGVDSHAARLAAVYDELERRIGEEPGVIGVTYASGLPGMSVPMRRIEAQVGNAAPFVVNGNLDGAVRSSSVAADYFETFGMPVLSGRGFGSGDLTRGHDGNGVVVVNESLAGNLGGNAVGARIRYVSDDDAPAPWYEVIGVVKNFGMDPTNRGDADFVFHPATLSAIPGSVGDAGVAGGTVGVRVNGDPAALGARLPQLALSLDPGLRLHEVLPLDEVVRQRDLPTIIMTITATAVILLALVLSAAGLFALMSLAVERRAREIGIRLALGATRSGVLSAIFARAAKQLGLGILTGNLLIIVIVQVVGMELTLDITRPLALVSGIMVLVGIGASYVPARRALRIQPTEALKEG